MIKQNRIKLIILILYFVGIIIHTVCFTRELALILTTPFLLITSIIILSILIIGIDKRDRPKTIIFIILAFLVTLFLEIFGSKTGLIFGEYTYGKSMMLKVYGVPIVIGLNWIVLLICSYILSSKILTKLKTDSTLLTALLAAIFLTIMDYFIEPVAIFLDYWNWEDTRIPLQNYIAWFGISFILAICARIFKVNLRNKQLWQYYLVVLVYFIILQVLLHEC